MIKALLDPKIDFVFKKIFGSEKHPGILISFLNAILKPKNPIVGIQFMNTDIEKNFVEDKFSRLDVKAETSSKEIINVEIQLKNEYNMIKRSLYYWSKLYEEQLSEGQDYSDLKRTVCINILNFKYLTTEKFHSGYRLKDIDTSEELTDVMEIHFIEIPKLKDESDEKDMLSAWTQFLKNPQSEKVRDLEMNIEAIKEAKDELVRLSNDDKERAIYEMRNKVLRDEISALNKAKEEGIEEGMEKGSEMEKISIAKNLLDVLDDTTISKKTGLSIEKITRLREENRPNT